MKLLLAIFFVVYGDRSYKMTFPQQSYRIVFLPVPDGLYVTNQVTISALERLDDNTYSMRLKNVRRDVSLSFPDLAGWRGVPSVSEAYGVITVFSSGQGDEYKVSLVNMNGSVNILFEAIIPRYKVPQGMAFEGSRLRFVRARGIKTEGEFFINSFDEQIRRLETGNFELLLRNITKHTDDTSLFASVGLWRGEPSIYIQPFTRALVIIGSDDDIFYNVTTEERDNDLAIVFTPNLSDCDALV